MKKILLVAFFALSIASVLSITCRAYEKEGLSERFTSAPVLGASADTGESPGEPVQGAETEEYAESVGYEKSGDGTPDDLSEYVISEGDAGYILSAVSDSGSEVVAEGELEALLDFCEGKTVRFDKITVEEDIELPSGKFTLTGSISTRFSVKVNVDTSVVLDSFELVLTGGGSLTVKGGEVSAFNTNISSSYSSAVSLISDLSSFKLHSGSIKSSSDRACVDVLKGSLEVLGGEIRAERSEAILNSSSLTLSGAPVISGVGYAVVSTGTLRLGKDSVPYTPTEALKLKYNSAFDKGTITPVCYINLYTSSSSVRVFDSSGREYPLTYFDRYTGVSEEAFLSVYLPYSVKYYSGSALVNTQQLLKGESVVPPILDAKRGYSFVGWYLDSSADEPLTQGFTVSEDTKLYGKYKLLAPEFSISSYSGEYSGRKAEISFDTLTHPLDGYGGRYELRWYKDGVAVSEGNVLSVLKVSDSGVYSCTITYYYAADSVSVRAEGISVIIAKRTVPIPALLPKEYNGKPQSPTVYPSSLYTASDASGTDAGIYSVTFTLTDTENYRFESGEGVVNVAFEITKANNVWTEEICAFDVYVGAEIDVKAKSLFGEPMYLFSESIDGEYSATYPHSPGKYFARALVPGNKNYNELVSEPIEFSIIDERAVALVLISPPSVTEYRAFDLISLSGASVKVIYNSGREEIISAERLAVSYQQGDSFRYGDSAAVVSYMGASVGIPVSVTRAVYDTSGVIFTDREKIYNTLYQSISYTASPIIGGDGIPLDISVSGGGLNVGEYTVTLSFSTDSQNYETPAPISAKLTILPYIAEICWQNTEFVYDGDVKTPTASYVDAQGIARYPKVFGGAVAAGEDYIAYTESADPNYSFTSDSVSYKITKADYDLSGAFWDGRGFVYDGTEKRVILSGLPDGVSVIGYTDAKATASGKYTATASLSFDERNYNAPEVSSYIWEIVPAKYDMSGVAFTSYTTVFDGGTHYPELVSSLPVGADGITPEYTFSQGATHVSEGCVTVIITFTTTSKNYLPPEPMSATVTVSPRGISVNWTGESIVYTGEALAPRATAPECKISVSGAAVDAGEYTAKAISQNSDYFVINSEFSFRILKAQNLWISPPYATDIYESGSLSVGGIAKSGAATVYYYTDPECKNECPAPTAPGIYYAIAVAHESKNYLALHSQPMRFEIIKVVPISLQVFLTKSAYVACSGITDGDVSARLIHNDGSELPLSVSDMTVIYQDSGELRFCHKEISFRHGDFEITLPINVLRADYDTSGVLWQNTVFYYDTMAKQPTLTGLPDGVSVVGYTTADAVRAGTYTTKAILSYDTENYNPPSVPACSFEIKKCTVNIPAVPTAEYDGKPHVPATSSPLYRFLYEEPYTSAGRYSFRARLTDAENYVFEDGSGECNLIFEITPRKISISVSDMNIYLWDKISEAKYVISDGSIVAGEDLELEQYEADGKIYLRTKNPNYSLIIVPGRINSLSYPSPTTSAKIIIGIIILIAAALLAFIIYLERERIADAIAIVKYRLKSRKKLKEQARGGADNDREGFFSPQILPKTEKNDTAENKKNAAESEVEKAAPLDTESNESDDEENEFNGFFEASDSNDTDSSGEDTEGLDGRELSENERYGKSDTADKPLTDKEEPLCSDESELCDEESYSDGVTQLSYSFTAGLDTNSETHGIDSERADELISDSLAKDLLKKGREVVYTDGDSKNIVNVDTLSQSFAPGERVDVNILKEKRLVPYDTAYLKVLARGVIDKPLSVHANDFSLSAVKMIALTGGEAVKVVTIKNREKRK